MGDMPYGEPNDELGVAAARAGVLKFHGDDIIVSWAAIRSGSWVGFRGGGEGRRGRGGWKSMHSSDSCQAINHLLLSPHNPLFLTWGIWFPRIFSILF